MKTTKLISYAYPTSIDAKRAGFYKTGCYVIDTIEYNGTVRKLPKYIKGFATLDQAKEFYNTLPYESDKYCLTRY